MRLIDADAVLRGLSDDLPYKGSVRRVLTQAQTVDAVQVTRCMDCESARERREARLREMLNTNYGSEPTVVVRYGK